MPYQRTDLAALIGSRICHDLISPIGAINNGLELLSMSGAVQGPEVGLISDSVNNASARIRFFRIAFGAAGDQLVGQAEIGSILSDLYADTRLDVTWDHGEPVPRSEVRMCFLAIMCAENAMPYGGKLIISHDNGNWQIRGSADRINPDPGIWAILSGAIELEPLQPSQVQFGLLPMIAREQGRRITCQSDGTSLTLAF